MIPLLPPELLTIVFNSTRFDERGKWLLLCKQLTCTFFNLDVKINCFFQKYYELFKYPINIVITIINMEQELRFKRYLSRVKAGLKHLTIDGNISESFSNYLYGLGIENLNIKPLNTRSRIETQIHYKTKSVICYWNIIMCSIDTLTKLDSKTFDCRGVFPNLTNLSCNSFNVPLESMDRLISLRVTSINTNKEEFRLQLRKSNLRLLSANLDCNSSDLPLCLTNLKCNSIKFDECCINLTKLKCCKVLNINSNNCPNLKKLHLTFTNRITNDTGIILTKFKTNTVKITYDTVIIKNIYMYKIQNDGDYIHNNTLTIKNLESDNYNKELFDLINLYKNLEVLYIKKLNPKIIFNVNTKYVRLNCIPHNLSTSFIKCLFITTNLNDLMTSSMNHLLHIQIIIVEIYELIEINHIHQLKRKFNLLHSINKNQNFFIKTYQWNLLDLYNNNVDIDLYKEYRSKFNYS